MTEKNATEEKMADLMKDIVQDLGSVGSNDNVALYRAMVRIWYNLRDDMSLQDMATEAARGDPETVEEVRKKVAEVLSKGKAVREQLEEINEINNEYPGHVCAFLQGIEVRWTPLSRPRLVKNKLKSGPI